MPGARSGEGPSGIVINSGNDWAKYGLYAKANNGLQMINMHFIDVNKNDPDPDLSSMYLHPDMSDSIELYNVSTWGTSPRFISMHGSPESRISITNLSYYLYVEEQRNRIHSGTLELVNGIRWVADKPITFDIGPEAKATFYSLSFPFKYKLTPDGIKRQEQDSGSSLKPSSNAQILDLYTFP